MKQGLVKKQIVDKTGKRTSVWVRRGETVKDDKKKSKVVIKRKIGFGFEKVKEFDSVDEAKKYMDGIIKRTIKKNDKAEKDQRKNAYGVETLPWFQMNGEPYKSEFDPRHKESSPVVKRREPSEISMLDGKLEEQGVSLYRTAMSGTEFGSSESYKNNMSSLLRVDKNTLKKVREFLKKQKTDVYKKMYKEVNEHLNKP